jgi:hypothetical protein
MRESGKAVEFSGQREKKEKKEREREKKRERKKERRNDSQASHSQPCPTTLPTRVYRKRRF